MAVLPQKGGTDKGSRTSAQGTLSNEVKKKRGFSSLPSFLEVMYTFTLQGGTFSGPEGCGDWRHLFMKRGTKTVLTNTKGMLKR